MGMWPGGRAVHPSTSRSRRRRAGRGQQRILGRTATQAADSVCSCPPSQPALSVVPPSQSALFVVPPSQSALFVWRLAQSLSKPLHAGVAPVSSRFAVHTVWSSPSPLNPCACVCAGNGSYMPPGGGVPVRVLSEAAVADMRTPQLGDKRNADSMRPYWGSHMRWYEVRSACAQFGGQPCVGLCFASHARCAPFGPLRGAERVRPVLRAAMCGDPLICILMMTLVRAPVLLVGSIWTMAQWFNLQATLCMQLQYAQLPVTWRHRKSCCPRRPSPIHASAGRLLCIASALGTPILTKIARQCHWPGLLDALTNCTFLLPPVRHRVGLTGSVAVSMRAYWSGRLPTLSILLMALGCGCSPT
eukprot:365930-Chlamydomonas_euryale.AAC.6